MVLLIARAGCDMGLVVNYPAGIHNIDFQITFFFLVSIQIVEFSSPIKTCQVQLLNIWLADMTDIIKPLPHLESPQL